MQYRKDHAQPLFRQRPGLIEPASMFVPVESHKQAVRAAVGALQLDGRVVVVFGPPGSGRSTVARQVARLVPRPSLFLANPPARRPLADKQLSREIAEKPSRVPPLLVVDSLTLDHAEWPWLLRQHAKGPHKLLVVSSTAWWLHYAETLQADAVGLGLKLLPANEVAHMADGYLRIKQPQAGELEPALLQSYNSLSEGLARKLVELVR